MKVLALLAGAAGVVSAVKVTPVEKVTTLLIKLKEKSIKQGEEDDAKYAKFSQFCKRQTDDKLYEIDQAEKKINKLSLTIEKLEADIEKHTETIKAAEAVIDEKTKLSEEETKIREDERKTYEKEDKELAQAVGAVKGAIGALKAGRPSTMLLQEAISAAHAVGSTEALVTLKKLSQAPATYEYHSSEIIATLQKLLTSFKEQKQKKFMEESDAKHMFDSAEQARQFTIKTKTELVQENEKLSAKKTAEKEAAEEEKAETEKDRDADDGFLKDLTKECEDKALLYRQRTESRKNEIDALGQAITLLKGEGGSNYTANKKLNLLEKSRRRAQDLTSEDDYDFLQMKTEIRRSHRRSMTERAMPKLFSFLRQKALVLKSPTLSMLVMKLGKDHFVKVRQLIKDLIQKLEAQADAEATKKGMCDEEMKKAIEQRDDSQNEIESLNATISSCQSKIADLKNDIKEAKMQIADLNKALNDATELRNQEKKAFDQQMKEAEAGLAAIKDATRILKNYYDNAFFLQQNPADSDGNTVGDLAPETFGEEYVGGTEEAKGIFSLLDVIQSDYERTIQTATDTEEAAVKEFEKYESDTKDSIAEKEQLVEDKKAEQEDTESELFDSEEELGNQTEKNKLAEETLKELKGECVDSSLTYEQRVARREQEIASLKEALEILREM